MDEHQRHRHRFRYETPATAGAIKGSIWLGSGNSRCVVSAVVPCARVMLFRPRQRHNRQDQQQTDGRTSCRYKFNSEKNTAKPEQFQRSKHQGVLKICIYHHRLQSQHQQLHHKYGLAELGECIEDFWLVGWGHSIFFSLVFVLKQDATEDDNDDDHFVDFILLI